MRIVRKFYVSYYRLTTNKGAHMQNQMTQESQLKPFRGLLTKLLHEAFYLEEDMMEVPLLENEEDNDETDVIRQFLGQRAC